MKVSVVITTACRDPKSTLEVIAKRRTKPNEKLLVHSCNKSFPAELIRAPWGPLYMQIALKMA